MGIDAGTLAALALVPLVEVAWADGSIDRYERNALLGAAEEAGLGPEGPSYRLLASWLEQRPAPGLVAAWKNYVRELCQRMGAEARSLLMQDLLGRARGVVEAADGFLGIGGISDEEQRALEDLGRAFA